MKENYTIGGNTVYLKYTKCNHGDITVRSINGSVRDSGFCGINGTFLRSGNLAGIAINSGAQVRNYGTKTAIRYVDIITHTVAERFSSLKTKHPPGFSSAPT